MDLAETIRTLTTRAAKARVLDGLPFETYERFYEVLGVNESLPYPWRNIQVPDADRAEYRRRVGRGGEAVRAYHGYRLREVPEFVWVCQGRERGDYPGSLWHYAPTVAFLAPDLFARLPALAPEGDPWREGRRGAVSYHPSIESAHQALLVAWLAAGQPEYLRE